jgi:hypothetical protein
MEENIVTNVRQNISKKKKGLVMVVDEMKIHVLLTYL